MATLANTRGESLTGSADFLANALNQRRQGINAAEAQAAQQSAIQQALGQALQGGAQGGPINTKAMASLMALDSDLGKNVLNIMQSNDEMARTQAQQAIEKQGKRAKFIQNQKDFAGKQRAIKSLAMEMAANNEDISKIAPMLNMSEQDLGLHLDKLVTMAQKADEVFKPATAQTKLGKATQDLHEGFISQEQFDKMQAGGVAEKGTFTKGTPVLTRTKDGPAFATPVMDSRDGSTRTVITKIPGEFLSRMGQTSNEEILAAINEAKGTKQATQDVRAATEPGIAGDVEASKQAARTDAEIERTFREKGIKSQSALTALVGAERLIDESTGSWGGAAIDTLASVFGLAPKGALANSKLKVLQANLMLSQPRMEGPQSDKDVQLYREAAGQIGNPTVPNKMKLAALETIRGLHSKYAEGGQSSGELPAGVTEEDITETMRAMNMTRDEVLERLKNGG